ncbi:MAG: hypothetical protein ACI9UA_000551 [Pseudoalteromonas tetraodonis]|jgi:hypothetical protein
MNHISEFPRAALTTDCVVFGLDDKDLKVPLIQSYAAQHSCTTSIKNAMTPSSKNRSISNSNKAII